MKISYKLKLSLWLSDNNTLIYCANILTLYLCIVQQSYGVTCFSVACCGAVLFLLGQTLVLRARGSCKSEPQFLGSITGFVGNSLIVIFLVSLLLVA